ncbi:hypothetical protein F8M41_003925 [Gigaspora margarita]|uniref:SHSP domain-containing protein n=1 Tax=Gigaspora margarita TaxID=4874 RepID=A0A8H3XB78_GIGMA|nr:hypothetical protein F8M41_003925 [Gigaspora margarita]
MCSGPIQGLADSELEKWLKTENEYSICTFCSPLYILIHTSTLARFFQIYKETQSKAPYDINSEQGYAPFAIYNDIQNGYINIIVFTPSITSKKDLEIIHSGDHEITIMARLQTIGVLGFVFINNLPNRFEVKVTLPNRIDEDCKAKVTINNGVTLISLKSKNSKRRIMIE